MIPQKNRLFHHCRTCLLQLLVCTIINIQQHWQGERSLFNFAHNMELCDGPLWDLSLTWWTSEPDFSPCFHHLVLTGLPLVFLVICMPIDIYLCCTSRTKPIPWKLRNIIRLLGIALIIVMEIVELVLTLTSSKKLFISSFFSPCAEIGAMAAIRF